MTKAQPRKELLSDFPQNLVGSVWTWRGARPQWSWLTVESCGGKRKPLCPSGLGQRLRSNKAVTKGTIEEKIQELQNRREHLVSTSIGRLQSHVAVWPLGIRNLEISEKPVLEKSRQYAITKCWENGNPRTISIGVRLTRSCWAECRSWTCTDESGLISNIKRVVIS